MLDGRTQLHVMCERDVGLFSLVQQVVANVPWALAEGRTPVAYFGPRTCYWTPSGYRGATTVWEYYFEAVVPSHPVEVIPKRVRAALAERHPSPWEVGYRVDHDTFASSHYGDHPQLRGRALPIPYRWADPGPGLRRRAKAVIDQFVRPRDYIQHRADDFVASYLASHEAIGVHVRGTDAASASEQRAFRQGSLVLGRYVETLEGLIAAHRQARIFVATAKQIWGGTEFRFVQHVNIGPYFIRRAAYRDLGGWDHTFSAPGEPGIGFDDELCLRAWMGGYQVAYSFVPFKGPPGHYAVDGGTALFSELRARNSQRNSATIFHRYGPYAKRIDQLVEAANAELAATPTLTPGGKPPDQN